MSAPSRNQHSSGDLRHEVTMSRKAKIMTTTSIASSLLSLVFFVVAAVSLESREPNQTVGSVCLGVEAASYLAIAWLYIYTSSHRNAKLISAVFLGTITILVIALSVKSLDLRTPIVLIFVADWVAITVFAMWMVSRQVRSWLRAYRATGTLPWQKQETRMENNSLHIAGLPAKFSYTELEAMTGNFQNAIGRGASGAIFRGTLEDGTAVAVKRIGWQPVGVAEFLTEVTIIASLQHYNLVRLLGYGTRGDDRYLVYPLFENGSLDAWLFASDENRARLAWDTRYQIAVGVAKALAYLHHECHQQILHLDIKPANILLDGDFRAHVSDFGISKSIGRDQTSVLTCGRGTVGYMAPEMLVNALSTKSDVYSYGMTLLELVGGRRNLRLDDGGDTSTINDSYFPHIARQKMMEGKLIDVVDASLTKDGALKEEDVRVAVQVALWCIQHSRELRPDMSTVVEMLEGRVTVNLPPESPMCIANFLGTESFPVKTGIAAEAGSRTPSTSASDVCTPFVSGR